MSTCSSMRKAAQRLCRPSLPHGIPAADGIPELRMRNACVVPAFRILLHMCSHTTICVLILRYVSSYFDICVLMSGAGADGVPLAQCRLTYAHVCSRMRRCWRGWRTACAMPSDVCSRMLAYARVCSGAGADGVPLAQCRLTYARVCSRMLAYAQVLARMAYRLRNACVVAAFHEWNAFVDVMVGERFESLKAATAAALRRCHAMR
jgi:hypothetical protein